MKKGILLTGDRPTGKLHIGHYVGSLENRVQLQDTYNCFFIIADLHTLTTKNSKTDIQKIPGYIHEMVLDYLACGISPEKSTIYVQSAIPEVYQLNLIFEMLVTVPRLNRIPSLKDMAREALLNHMPFGLLGYPVLQAADILMVKAGHVPVGKDNEAHIELTREIAQRFNTQYGQIFPLPETISSDFPVLPGTDGKTKMGKSANNAIYLSDDVSTVMEKVMRMYTDPQRVRADVPGTVAGNPVFIFHDAFNRDKEEVTDLKDRYKKGAVGDIEVKKKLVKALNCFLAPLREKRQELANKPDYVRDILSQGNQNAKKVASKTLEEVGEVMGLTFNR